MSTYLNVDLEGVDVSFKLPPAGIYTAIVESFEIRTDDSGGIKDVKFTYGLLEGDSEGVGLKISEYMNPGNEVGLKRMKMLALACEVPFDKTRIDLELFPNHKMEITVVHKPGKTGDTIFANVKSYAPCSALADLA